ncbi:MAG: hypothetical protein H6720_12780 [Sandaracinus sp.]|nr:hypothetical protein [Sandaracinus sp.]
MVRHAEQRFREAVSRGYRPMAFGELPVWVMIECSLPTGDLRARIDVGPDGHTTNVTVEGDHPTRGSSRCLAEVARKLDVSDWLAAVKAEDFLLASIELELHWHDGRPLQMPRVIGRHPTRRR